jgi:GNAT superfamily N-acetyltransferase
MAFQCFECGVEIAAVDDELADTFLAHARTDHEWPYPDQAVRNYAEATLRLGDDTDRVDAIGEIEVYPVTIDRLDDWTEFFDHRAFAGNPEWAACYCFEPHSYDPEVSQPEDAPHWRANREGMRTLLRDGRARGYLAYVDGVAAGWVNASLRSDYSLYRLVDPDGPEAGDVIGVSCFIIAPPYRRHGVAAALFDRVLADAHERGAAWVEGYPNNDPEQTDASHFRGPRSLFDDRGFEEVERLERYTVMRRSVE